MLEKQAMYYEKREEGYIKCLLCPQGCTIKEGGTGFCNARKNAGGQLYSINYGKISSLALDPIEKKPLRLFYPGRLILSAGSFGCNLRCPYCQNFEISQQEPLCQTIAPNDLINVASDTVSSGNIGIAYTYNEPLIGYEYVYDCASLAKEKGLKNVLVTNGYINPEPMKNLLPYIDAMNIDLKAFNQAFYNDLCKGKLEHVKDTITLCADKCHIEVTTLLIPGYNDSEEEISSLSKWLSDISPGIPLHLTRYYPNYRMKAPQPISKERINELASIAKQNLNNIFY